MKKLLLLLIIFCFNKACFSQSDDIWNQYLKDSVYNSENKEFIYLYSTKGRKIQKLLYYSTKMGQNILSINYGDSLIIDKIFHSPDLFEMVENNLGKIKKVCGYQTTQKKIIEHKKNFSDSSIVYSQLGIKYKKFQYNHFQKLTTLQIENEKNIKRKEGMKIINLLYELLEMAERNK